MRLRSAPLCLWLAALLAACGPAATPAAIPAPSATAAGAGSPDATATRAAVATMLVARALATASAAAGQATATRVDVGGYQLFIRCMGTGSPTVVLDAGAGGSSTDWSAVQPELAHGTRVCAYDRANRGRSDRGPATNTAEQMVADLHALLAGAGLAGPYVLVGASFGGLVSQLYAIRHPEETVGLVLVDSAHPRSYGGRTAADAVHEGVDLKASAAQVLAAGPLPRHLRLAVLTRDPRRGSMGQEVSEEQWQEWQRELAAALPDGRHVVVEGSGHNIAQERPQAVIDAVRQVLQHAGR